MKRTVYLLLAVVTLFSFSACGKGEKYSKMPEKIFQTQVALEKMDYRALVGGALAVFDRSLFLGRELSEEAEEVIVLFDEKNMSLMPLCSADGCFHNTDDCFEKKLSYVVGKNNGYWDVVDGEILIIDWAYGRIYDEEQKHKPATLTAYYYSFSGEQTGKIEHDLKSLVTEVGKPANNPMMYSAKAEYGGTVFLNAGDISGSRGVNRWVIPYNTAAKRFEPETAYTTRPSIGVTHVFSEVGRNTVGISVGDNYRCIVNTAERTSEVNSMYAMNSGMQTITKAMGGNPAVLGIYPLKGLVKIKGVNGAENVFWNYMTAEPVSLTKGEEKLLDGYEMISVGRCSYCSTDVESNEFLEYVEVKSNEICRIKRAFDGGACRLEEMIFESEDGLVFKCSKSDGDSLVYVSKKDFFDGEVSVPLFYDAETYSFVQR